MAPADPSPEVLRKPVTIPNSGGLWYRIQHNWVGGDGFGSQIVEGGMIIGMALFFAGLLGFSHLCRIYDRIRYWREFK